MLFFVTDVAIYLCGLTYYRGAFSYLIPNFFYLHQPTQAYDWRRFVHSELQFVKSSVFLRTLTGKSDE